MPAPVTEVALAEAGELAAGRPDAADADRQLRVGAGAAVDDGIRRSGWLAYVVRRDSVGRLGLAPGWPLWALLVLFPLWWALGLGSFIFPILAVPMAIELVRRRHRVRLPRAWLLWALYLGWIFLSLTMYTGEPSGVHPGTMSGRVIATATQIANYLAGTVAMLFAGNLDERELPLDRLVRWLGALFIITVAGGLLGTVAPQFQFTSPTEYILPARISSNTYVQSLIHPAAAQLQDVLGTGVIGRAAAPFGYTNFWANNLSILAVWFICGWWARTRNSQRRVACAVIVGLAVVPVITSYNRGLWIGVAVSVVWVTWRLLLAGRLLAALMLMLAVVAGAGVLLATPLQSQVSSRLEHGQSNSIRTLLTDTAVKGAEESPILGWGGTRKTIGSAQSLAIGASPDCPQCGDFPVGGNGQFWAVLFEQGFVGAALYVGFFFATLVLHWRDRSPIGQAGVLVIALSFVYMFVYNALPAAFTLTMISVGILQRSLEQRSRAGRPVRSLLPRPPAKRLRTLTPPVAP